MTSAPIVTANWKAEGSQRWTVPVGGGVGKIFHLGKLPVNAQLSAYYNVVTPDDGANWQIRAQVQFMFPKEGGTPTEAAQVNARTARFAPLPPRQSCAP